MTDFLLKLGLAAFMLTFGLVAAYAIFILFAALVSGLAMGAYWLINEFLLVAVTLP